MRSILIGLITAIAFCFGVFYPKNYQGYHKITQATTVSKIERQLFCLPRGFVYVLDSGGHKVAFCVDEGWHRVVYAKEGDDWIKAWGKYSSGNDGFKGPTGICKDYYRNIYVADEGNGRIVKLVYNPDNEELQYVTEFPIGGSGSVWDIDFEVEGGNFFVTDPVNHHIYKLDSSGTILVSYGTKGRGVGQFWGPKGIACSDKNIYVADECNKRIVWLRDEGNYLEWKGVRYLTEWESPRLRDVEVDIDGFVYVIDFLNAHILKFSPDLSQLLLVFGSEGYGENQFYHPSFMHIQGNDVVITEEWSDSSGIQYYGIRTGISEAKVMIDNFDATERNTAFYFKLDGQARVSIGIRDSLGHGVTTLITDSLMDYGAHLVEWDGRDNVGKVVLPGLYICDIYAVSGSEEHSVHLNFKVKGTVKSGTLSPDEHWTLEGSPYVLTGDVQLQNAPNETLQIDPGVKVMPAGNYGIYPPVYWSGGSVLRAQGNPINKILFTPHRKLSPVPDSVSKGFWKGIMRVGGSWFERLVLDHCVIEAAGSDSIAVWASPGTNYLSITHTKITKSGGIGVYSRADTTLVYDCQFIENDSIPLIAPFKVIDRIYDNRFVNNRVNVIAIEGGYLHTDATIHNQGVPYWFLKGHTWEFVVESTNDTYCPTLTIQPGVKIFFHDSSGLYPGGYFPTRGKVFAQGTPDSMIIFSALDTTKFWRGIHIRDYNIADTSRFEYCEISYGGQILQNWLDRPGGSISFLYDHTPYILKNSKIKRSLNSGCGNFWGISGRDSLISCIQNNLFEGNDSVPLYLGANELGGCYGNSFVNNGINEIFVKNEQIDHSLTIAHQGIPYVFYPKGNNRLLIDGRGGVAQVLISSGNTLKFAGGYLVIGDSGLIKARSVTFTPYDTAWGGIKFDYAEVDTSVFDSCLIEKAVDYSVGDWPYGAIHLNGSRVRITNSTIVNNRKGLWLAYQNKLNLKNNLIAQNRYGIYRTSSDFIPDSIIIKGNGFLGNKVAVINIRTSTFLNADSNWWGHETGPWDPSIGPPDYNPQGKGDSIGDYVIYRPWLTSPVQEPKVTLLQPNGGEVLYSGEHYEIRWRFNNTKSQVNSPLKAGGAGRENSAINVIGKSLGQLEIGGGIGEIIRQELYYTTDFPEGGSKAEAFWRFIDSVPVGETSYVWSVPNTPSKRCRVVVKIYYESEKQSIGETGMINGDLGQFKAQRGLREIKEDQGISGADNYGTEVPTPEDRDRPVKSEMVAVDISDANFTIAITTDFAFSTAYNNGHKIVSSPTGKKVHFVYANEGWTVPSGIFNCYSDDSGKTFSLIQIDSSGLYPAIALRKNGQPCAAWPTSGGIGYAYWTTSWTEDTLGYPVENSSPPSIAVDNSDTVHLLFVWYPSLPPVRGNFIYLKFPYNNLAGAIAETLFVENFCHFPSIAVGQDRALHILWQGEKSICYLMKDSNGMWHNIDTIYTTITNEKLYPVIDLYGNGIMVVWQDKDSLGNLEIYSRIKTDVGWDSIKKVASTTGESRFPSLAGAHYCLWQDNSSGNWEVYKSEYIDTLGAWIGPENISNSATASAFPHCAYALVNASNAKLYTLWTEGDTIPYLIKFQRLDVSPVAKIFADLGQPIQSPYSLERDGYWIFGDKPYETTDWGYENLQYKFTGLDPEKEYRFDLAYYFENNPQKNPEASKEDNQDREGYDGHRGIGRIIQAMVVDGVGLDTAFITPNHLKRVSVWLPEQTYLDGEIIVEFRKIKGKRVVCSEMGLYEFPKEQRNETSYGGPMGEEGVIKQPFFFEQILPNPTRGMIKIRFNSPDKRRITIKLYDVCARLVCEQNITKSRIGMNEVLIKPKGLSAGVYFVRFETAGYEKTEKVILLR